ncbi:hypothetical protein CWO89_31235 [Bradyrhizobium sp. Leo170]|nr:hypothetical protein CWO89_31235 [Bradyrhizobium sp. Leo170]
MNWPKISASIAQEVLPMVNPDLSKTMRCNPSELESNWSMRNQQFAISMKLLHSPAISMLRISWFAQSRKCGSCQLEQ